MDRKIDFVTNEADERPIYAVFGDILWCRDTGNEYIYDGTAWQEYKMRYKDLGLVIDAVNVAAGATVYTPWYDNTQWVKNILFFLANTATGGNVSLNRINRDSSGRADVGFAMFTGTVSTNLDALSVRAAGSAIGATTTASHATLGKSTRFALINSASVVGNLRLAIQLID